MRPRTITTEEPVTDTEAAIATERARCAAVLRDLARAHATQAGVTRHLVRVAAYSEDIEDLMRLGRRYTDLVAKAEAFAEAAAAVEEEPGT
jgi:hypothetical protein